MIKVGKDRISDYSKKNGYRIANYKDVIYDFDDWVDANKFIPMDFDLVTLRSNNKEFKGWSVGMSWDGYRHTGKEEILQWRKAE